MRIIKTEIKVYKFNELINEAKEEAVKSLWDVNVGYDWWKGVEVLPEYLLGALCEFDIDRKEFIYFVGLEIAYHKKGKYLTAFCKALGIPEDWRFDIDFEFLRCVIDGNEVNYISINFDDKTYKDDGGEHGAGGSNEVRKTTEEAEIKFKGIMKKALQDLKNIYEALVAEEAVIKTIEAKGYEFLVDGERYNDK